MFDLNIKKESFRKIGKKLYVNQARVIRNIPLLTDDGKKQQLYLIGEARKCLGLKPRTFDFLL